MRELERRVVLSVLDRKWREHLYEMDYLREGIGLRAYSQRDPLVEYQREGFDMFAAMMDGIKEESVGFLFNLEVQVEDEEPTSRPGRADARSRSAASDGLAGGAAGARHEQARRRRSAPRASRRPSSRRTCPTPRPSEDGDGRGGRRAPADASSDDPFAGVGRNAECPCGSGKKYKKCHGAPGGPDRPHHPRQRLTGPPDGFATPPSRATASLSPVMELFENYRDGAGPAYDEMFDGAQLRGPYETLAASLDQVTGSEVRARAEALTTLYLEQGVTFDIGGEERPFPLDIVPRVIEQDEWAVIEPGRRSSGSRRSRRSSPTSTATGGCSPTA